MVKKEALNIMFTCVGRRNYLVNYFKEALNGLGNVIAVDKSLSASGLVDADRSFQVSSIDSEEYIDELKAIIKKENVKAIISLNDLELPILSKNKSEFEKLGVQVLVSDEKTIEICYDKWKTYLFLKEIELKTPKTFLSCNEVLDAIKKSELSYPLIVKPRWGSASIGINEVENEKELLLSYELLKLKINKTIHCSTNLIDAKNCIVIQEKIEGQEYGMDILNDFNGNYYASFVRKKLIMRSGETDKAMSVINEKYSRLGKILGSKIRHIGNMDCDFFVSNGEIYFLEMNPRFGGGYPFSHNAGVHIPSIYVEWLKGNNDIDKFNKYQHGLSFAKYDQMIKIENYHLKK